MTETITQLAVTLIGYLAIAWGVVLLIAFAAALVTFYKGHRRSCKEIEALQRHHALHIERRPPV
jgi:hypothetical protein